MFAMPMLMQPASGGFDPATDAYEWFDPTDAGSLSLVGGTDVSRWVGQNGNLEMTQGGSTLRPKLTTKNSLTALQMHNGGTDSRYMGVNSYSPAYVAAAWWGDDAAWTYDSTRSLFGRITGGTGYMPIGQDGSSTTEWERGYQGTSVFRDGTDITPTDRNLAYDNIMNAHGVFEFVNLNGVETVNIENWGAGGAGAYQSYGVLGDIIYMTATPDLATRAAIRSFLASKWGL